MNTVTCSGNENEIDPACSWQSVGASPDQRERLWSGNEVHVWRAFFPAWRSQAAQLAQSLSEQENARMQRFRDPAIAIRYVIGRGLLRELLGKYLGVSATGIQISTNIYGKPELATAAGGRTLYFNLAHTNDIVLYGLTRMCPIGVDIESVEAGPVSSREARRILSNNEWRSWQEFPDKERSSLFCQTWVRKEAVLKALGVGLSIEPDTFSVGFAPQSPVLHVQRTTLCIHDLLVKASVKAAVALTDAEMPHIRCFTADVLT